MDKQDPQEVIARLMRAATDDDKRQSILEAAISAKYWWRCTCGRANVVDEKRCHNCDALRPPELDPPKEVIHILWHGVTLCGKSLDQNKWVRREEARSATCDVCFCRAENYAILTS